MHLPSNVLARYIIVGGASYLVEMATLWALAQGLGLGPVLSVAISFWVGFVVAFLLQKYVTFKNHNRQVTTLAKQVAVYGALVAWNYTFTLVAVHFLTAFLSVFIVRTMVIIIVTLWNFVIYKTLFKE